MWKKISTGLLVFNLLAPVFAHAQLGTQIVYDPANYKNAVLRYIQLQKQLAELQRTYTEVQAEYQLALAMSQNLKNMGPRYQATFSRWGLASGQDAYGTTTDWFRALNGNLGLLNNGYRLATSGLDRYSQSTLLSLPPSSQDRTKSDYSLVELADGANMDAMSVMGNIRLNNKNIEAKIANLEQDSLSSSKDLNTQVEVLNKINATNVLMLRSIQDTNKLLLSLLEQQLALSKRLRDPAAESLDDDIHFRTNFGQAMQFNSTVNQSLEQKLAVP
jgi:hypothetical protein